MPSCSLLPLLERDFNPQVREALTRLSEIAARADESMQHQASHMLARVARQIEGGVEIQMKYFRHGSAFGTRYALMGVWRRQGWPLQDMSFEKWDQLTTFAQSSAPDRGIPERQIFPGNVCAEKQGGVLRLTRPVN